MSKLQRITIPKDILKDIEAGKYRDFYLVPLRKSTDEPNIQKNSFSYQRAGGLGYAHKFNLPIAPLTIEGFCRDGVISERHSAYKENYEMEFVGDNMIQIHIERPKFYLMTQWLNKGYFKGAIHLCWDRASRNKADDTILRKLMKSGVDMRFVLTEYDKNSSGELHMDVEGMFAAHHSRVTSEKVTLTFRNSRERGLWTHKAGVGYLNEGNMDHKPRHAILAPIILECARMIDNGSSLAATARWAIEQGFTMPPMRRRRTPDEMLAEEEDEDGNDTSQSKIEKISRLPTANSIHKILTNRFYTGKLRTKDGLWIQSTSHEAIIPEDLFNRIQEKLKLKNKSAHYANVLDHPCRYMFRCGLCGRVYTPYEQKGIIYFGARCAKDCANPKKSFNLAFITGEVGKLIDTLPYTREQLEELDARTSTEIALLETKRLSLIDSNDRKKKAIRESIAYLNTHRLDLLKAGAYTPEQVVVEENKLHRELASLKEEEDVSDEVMRATVRDLTTLSELLKDGSIYYSHAKPKEKERVIRSIFSELSIVGDTVQFKCKNGFKALESRFAPNYEDILTFARTFYESQ